MAASDSVSPNQFRFKYQQHEGIHNIDTFDSNLKRNLGWMQWRDEDGRIEHISVNNDMRRQGIATAMWNRAHQLSEERGIPAPQHSPIRTTEGDAWAKKVGGNIPRLRKTSLGRWNSYPTDPDKDELLP